jgi:hypothetical protein
MEYGAIGTLIGHEITHGFDDKGRKFDAGGNNRDWWTPAIASAFEARANCLRAQYGGYTVLDDAVSALVLTGATWAWWTRSMEPQEFQARIDRGRMTLLHGPNDVHVRHNERHIPGFLGHQPAQRPLARRVRERAPGAYVGCARDRCCAEGLAPVVDAHDFSPAGNHSRSFACRSPERLDVPACHGSLRRLPASRRGAMVTVQPPSTRIAVTETANRLGLREGRWQPD